MSLLWGYQVYDMFLPKECIHERYTERKEKIFADLESKGLTVEMFYPKSKGEVRVMIYHPRRVLDFDELNEANIFVTLDEKLIHNQAIENAFKIRILHPKEL